MKKRILTWLKPTSDQLHLGNYFGAIKPIIDLQNGDDEVFLFVASLHALTTLHDADKLRDNIRFFVKMYLACWVDPVKVFIYDQAHVPAHTQLERVLWCLTHMGFMQRMHVYKDAASKGTADALSVGTFSYPILQAADIILYDVTHVPVGQDQKQHIEYARDIADKFNRNYDEVFVLPEPMIVQWVAIVPGIDGRKMSKSYDNFLWLLDTPAVVKKKVKMIVTDALPIEASKDPDTCNVYNILKLFLSQQEDEAVRKRYTDWGLGYGVIKDELYVKVIEFVTPIQERFATINDDDVITMLQHNTARANEIAQAKIAQVYRAVGLL